MLLAGIKNTYYLMLLGENKTIQVYINAGTLNLYLLLTTYPAK